MHPSSRCEICDRKLANSDSPVGDTELCWRVWYQNQSDGGKSSENCLMNYANWRRRAKVSELLLAAIIKHTNDNVDPKIIPAVVTLLEESKETAIILDRVYEILRNQYVTTPK